MPFGSTLAIIASIASLAGTGITVGETLANQPGSPKPPPTTPAAETPAQQTATQNQQKALINQQLPNILSETSGLANPDYVKQIAQLLSGTAGQSGSSGAASSAVERAFGLPANFTPAGSPGSGANSAAPVSLSDFVNNYLG
jgi:hypothetical protein